MDNFENKAVIKEVNCTTVGELIEHLKKFDPNTPIEQGFEKSVDVVHFNYGQDSEHVSFSEGGEWT